MDITTAGIVKRYTGGSNHNWLSLSGITFFTSGGTNLPFNSYWSNYGAGWHTCQYKKFSDGIVVVQGLAKTTTSMSSSRPIATLPAGFRPKRRLIFVCNNHAYTTRIDVLTNGQILWVGGGNSHSWISLTCITFYTD